MFSTIMFCQLWNSSNGRHQLYYAYTLHRDHTLSWGPLFPGFVESGNMFHLVFLMRALRFHEGLGITFNTYFWLGLAWGGVGLAAGGGLEEGCDGVESVT